ncbi:hypothetical protein [Amycolatopsis sp. SID8362]|uniref:hypothetical protein n=1 Tax=Amycolatopsis sp. SID8362 TaxID=2690346 RepID=UPI001367FF2A|nr:hypothetical protein [Amycolatopsis sp. SID8362]NBH09777.1 hypothetical protein [Amycolatopsis sp. SID8362]NED46470.1 hypothetical protein [Amycolatopsis sp. SID8362]
MDIAALIAWLVTAVGGFVMLGTWIAKGGTREPGRSRFNPGLVFGHFALAAAGLVLWIVYLIAGGRTLAWIAFVLLVPVALLGFTMLARWIPGYRARAATADPAPEQHFPVVVVGAHGLVAVVTVVLVLLAALGVGS